MAPLEICQASKSSFGTPACFTDSSMFIRIAGDFKPEGHRFNSCGAHQRASLGSSSGALNFTEVAHEPFNVQ